MALRYIIEENLRGPLWSPLVRANSRRGLPLEIACVGEESEPPLGMDDPEILLSSGLIEEISGDPFMSDAQSTDSVLDTILKFNQDRKPKLLRLKLRRMSQDPFTFFRGAVQLFARDWLELSPPEAGPDILICGDLHLENFGAYRTAEGDFRYDINDFDEAAVAPSSLDLVRCTTSIFLAAEQWKLTPTAATSLALGYLGRYRRAITEAIDAGAAGELAPRNGHGAIWELLESTASGIQEGLLERNTKRKLNGKATIRRTDHHPEISRKRFESVREAIETHGQTMNQPEVFRVHDITGRIAGVGSLGVRRYLALIEGDGRPDGLRLIDIKQVEPSALLGTAATTASQPDWGGDDARRVVTAQITLQGHPAAGLDVLRIGPYPYRVREMIPEENRSSLDRFRKQPVKLRAAVETAGLLTAWSHLRGARLAPGSDQKTDHWPELADWAAGAAIDAVLAAAARYAERTNHDHAEFLHAARRLAVASYW